MPVINTVLNKLATSLNRRDGIPNQLLAKEIANANDKKGVKEVFELLNNKDKNIQSNCIKVIDEVGKLKPALISGYANELIATLDHKNNRLQWRAMIALNNITTKKPDAIYAALGKIIDAADKGSVITNDHCVKILVKLGSIKKYAEDVFVLLNERILISPVNQLPTYAESALPLVNDNNREAFLIILTARLGDIEQATKRKRLEKVIKKVRGK